jgi:hypothetical protein
MTKTIPDTPTTPAHHTGGVLPPSDLDTLLTAQIAVAWAGERGEQPRLRWWDSDMTSEMGGEDLFQQLLPVTWEWATLQAARAAAMRCDAALRARDHAPDAILTLYAQGFVVDELAEERLQALKRSGVPPESALPGLTDLIKTGWDRDRFIDWLDSFGAADRAPTPIGRLVKGPVPEGLDQRVRKLVGALNPLGDTYSLPHYRRPA